jgi:GDP-L-fucose synthase
MDWRKKRILITGGTGMVGHALCKQLCEEDCRNMVLVGSKEYDLRDKSRVDNLFFITQPDYVFHLAGKVYGIGGNAKFKATSLSDNILINTNLIDIANKHKVKKIVAMGSGCVYPELPDVKFLKEDQIWLGPPHESEDSYAHAKRLMLAHLEASRKQYGTKYAFAISGNLYGEWDKFDTEYGHVIPSLIKKFYDAKKKGELVSVWGTGVAVRDFSYSLDTARALVCLMDKGEGAVNIGSGFIHSIKDIVDILRELTGCEVVWQKEKPNGQLERYYDLSKLKNLGFEAKVPLQTGLEKVYEWYQIQKGVENECGRIGNRSHCCL